MVFYEWAVDVVEDKHRDIEHIYHSDNLKDIAAWLTQPLDNGFHYEVCLIRDQYNNEDPGQLDDRQWAYIENGKFVDGEFDGGAKIPKKFFALLEKAQLP